MSKQEKFKSEFEIPDGMNVHDQIVYCIGMLIVVWSGCECAFLYLFRCMVGKGEDNSAHLIWLSNQNIRTKTKMVIHMARVKRLPEPTIDILIEYAKRFSAITKTRNAHCHGYYNSDGSEQDTSSFEFATLHETSNSDIFSYSRKPLDKTALGALVDAIKRAEKLVYDMGPTLNEVHTRLEVHDIKPVELPLRFGDSP